MNPIKIVGGVLIVLGLIFRAICIADFKRRAPFVPDTAVAQKRFAASRRRALLIDYFFIAFGLYTLLMH